MRYVKLFEQFVNERFIEDEIPQLQIIKRGKTGLNAKDEDFTVEMMNLLYDKYIHLILIREDDDYNDGPEIHRNRRYNRVRHGSPLLNFNSRYHEDLGRMRARVFNKVEDIQLSADKVKFYKTFADSDFIPKSVYRIDDIEELELPIIAKPAEGYSAQGIEKFDSYEDARKSDLKFDVWQEAKDIDREFRAFVMDSKIIHISERITNLSNDMSVGKKDADEKIDLVYIDQIIDEFPHLEQIEKIKEVLAKEVRLEFYAIDIILDTDGKIWIPEINGAPGIGPSMFYNIYKAWVKMAYGQDLKQPSEDELQRVANNHREKMKQTYPKEYKNSLMPL